MKNDEEYLRVVTERFKYIKELGDKTIAQLSEEEMHWASNSESNSIVVIMKHLSGNMISRLADFLTTDVKKIFEIVIRNLSMISSAKQN